LTTLTVSSEVVIREARESDFGWIADLMDQALSPFYGGDHRAHARRIFDTHIQGGVDHVGHFSAGQHMFVADVDGRAVGVIHVVSKKQETVKISPLIVDPGFRGNLGIGSRLLDHAEMFAYANGARQLYCTVAAPNTGALGFFLSKGFHITGTARNHYKCGVDEHMLYKPLLPDTTLCAPNVSVVPFDEERHAGAVRELIFSQMQGNFLGVDEEWVQALLDGYKRRDSNDVNAKFKIIFVAESCGRVVGVAGATPKKGDPIKLMPLLADNEAAFEALIIDLRGLLMDYGHKLYMHLVPEAWQIACLQRHGWSFEGIFPEGYAPGSVVQQWGLNMNNGGDKPVKDMRIKRPYFNAIMDGTKTLEVRVGYDSIKRIQVGDTIKLQTAHTSGQVTVKSVRRYDGFEGVLGAEPWQQIAPEARNAAAVLRLLRGIYGPDKEALGVYVFEIEPKR